MSELGDKLREIRKNAGMNAAAVIREMGKRGQVVNNNVLSKWEIGITKPTIIPFLHLCDIYGVRDPYSIFVGDRRKLNELGLTRVAEYERLLLNERQFIAKRRREVRYYDMPASAGTGSYMDSDDYEEIEVDEDEIPNGTDYAVRVSGDSMEPDFHDGQMVFVRETGSLEVGDIGIFGLGGDVYIKKLGRGKLISLNPKYKPIPIREDDTFRVYGEVLG